MSANARMFKMHDDDGLVESSLQIASVNPVFHFNLFSEISCVLYICQRLPAEFPSVDCEFTL